MKVDYFGNDALNLINLVNIFGSKTHVVSLLDSSDYLIQSQFCWNQFLEFPLGLINLQNGFFVLVRPVERLGDAR